MSELDPTASRSNHVLLVTCVYISFTHFFYSQNLDWNLQKEPRAAHTDHLQLSRSPRGISVAALVHI